MFDDNSSDPVALTGVTMVSGVVVSIIGTEISVEGSEDDASYPGVDAFDELSVFTVMVSEVTVNVVPAISGVDLSPADCMVDFSVSDVDLSIMISTEVISRASVVCCDRLGFVKSDVEASVVVLEVDPWISCVVNSVMLSDEVISTASSATFVVDSVVLEFTVCDEEDSRETDVIREVMVAVSVDTCELDTNSGLIVS